MIKAVLFDRDGVLMDTERVHLASVRTALLEMGFAFGVEEEALVIGRHRADYKADLLKKFQVDWDEFVKRQSAAYDRLLDPKAQLIPQAVELVHDLKKRKFKLALVTSSSRRGTEKILKAIGLEGVFDVIVAHEDCVERKPSPAPYLLTAKKLGVSPQECVVVEDAPVGVLSAKRAGMRCLMIKTDLFLQDASAADKVVGRSEMTFKNIQSILL